MSNSKKIIREQATQLITKSNDSFEKFKQFLFAPNLLTFVISVVVGNSFGSTIKELVNFVFGIFKFVQFFFAV
jgi:large-conductance mechanosensitive channel